MKSRLVVLAVICILFSGCALNSSVAKSKLLQIGLNMTPEQVKGILGDPYSTEIFIDNRDNKTLLVWNYRTEYFIDIWGQGWQNITPFVFKDNALIGWGSDFCKEIAAPRK